MPVKLNGSTSGSVTVQAPAVAGTNTLTLPAATGNLLSDQSIVPGSASVPTNGMYLPATNALGFATNSTNAMYIDASQNVGIGTASPNASAKLTLAGTSTNSALLVYNNTAAANTGLFGSVAAITGSGTSNDLAIGAFGSSNMTFYTAAAERMRIDTSGNLLVGATSGSYHTLAKTLSSNYSTAVINNSATAPYGLIISLGAVSGGAGGGFFTCADNANRLIIAGNGNVTNVNNSYGAISDVSLKENIVDATPKLSDLLKVQIRSYNMKETPDHKQIGVVAQELETVFPGMIEVGEDGLKSVKYSVFVPMLVKAIQELSAKNDALETRLSALEAK